MSKYYTGKWAQCYNTRWHTLIERTLTETLAMIDFATLCNIHQSGRHPHWLDVGCGTGILLKTILEYMPDINAYGVDASKDMLMQAHIALSNLPNVSLEQIEIGIGNTASLPYSPQTFDLITCTNMLHYVSDPVAVLAELRQLLAPGGCLVVEDYSRPEPPFPWSILEWLARRLEGQHARKHTLMEAQSLCRLAGLQIVCGKTFMIDWLWCGWILRLSVLASEPTNLNDLQ